MDINKLQRFTGKGHNVLLHYYSEYGNTQWTIKLEAKHEGTKLEITASGDTPEEAFKEAAAKFDRATFSGVPELNPSLVYEGRVEDNISVGSSQDGDRIPIDDEASF